MSRAREPSQLQDMRASCRCRALGRHSTSQCRRCQAASGHVESGHTHFADAPCGDVVGVIMQDKLAVDVGLWGGIVPANAGDAKQLQDMWDLGVLGFKSFMPPSGLLPSLHHPDASTYRIHVVMVILTLKRQHWTSSMLNASASSKLCKQWAL